MPDYQKDSIQIGFSLKLYYVIRPLSGSFNTFCADIKKIADVLHVFYHKTIVRLLNLNFLKDFCFIFLCIFPFIPLEAERYHDINNNNCQVYLSAEKKSLFDPYFIIVFSK